MADGIQAIANDPDFYALPLDERAKVMQHFDSDFGGLPQAEQYKAVSRMQKSYNERNPPKAPETPASPVSRFASGVVSGAKAMVPTMPDATTIALSGLGPIPSMVRGAASGYQEARDAGQGVGESLAAGAGSLLGLDTKGIRERASKGDVAGVVGEGVPAIAATLLGGEVSRRSPNIRAAGGAIGDALRTEEGALKPGVRAVSHAAGAAAGSTLGPGGTLAGTFAGPALADAIIPNRSPLPGVEPTLPSSSEFYENRARDIVARGKAQDALDRAAARTSIDPVREAVRQGIASRIPTRIPKVAPPVDELTSAVRQGIAARLPIRMPKPPTVEPPSPFTGMQSSSPAATANLPARVSSAAPSIAGGSLDPSTSGPRAEIAMSA